LHLRPKRKRASARQLTPAELTEWFNLLNSHIERQRLTVAQNAMPRSSRRLMHVRDRSAYVMRGIAWWNAMNLRERLEALRAADTAEPAQAWHYREAMRRPVMVASGHLAQAMEVSHV
jgi:hypothetical protein